MRNSKESKIKKAIASVLIVLAISMGLTSSITLAQEFDKTKSAVAYCSQPLKVKIGSIYDYRYFVYASKVGSSDLNIKIEKGFANSLENLYPGSKAQLNGKQITVKDSTSFILHDLGGGELALSGDAQFAPSEKCDELVATMTAINGYAKQKLIEDEDLVGAQMELVKAMTAATAAITTEEFIGYKPPLKTPYTPASPYAYDAAATVKWLEDNGRLGTKFLEEFDNFLSNEEKNFPEIKDMTEDNKIKFLLKKYDNEWLNDISGKVTVSEKAALQRYSDALRDTSITLSNAERRTALEALTTQKIYKHSSDPSKSFSLAEYLSKADEGIDVEYKMTYKQIDPVNYPQDVVKYGEAPHLQTFQKSTGALLSETPIVVFQEPTHTNGGAILFTKKNDPNTRVIGIVVDEYGISLQQTASNIVHESSHETTYALKSYLEINVGMDEDTAKIWSEGLAVDDANEFADEQGSRGSKLNKLNHKRFFITDRSFGVRNYANGAEIIAFIKEKLGGQAAVSKIKAGTLKVGNIVDIQSLPTILKQRHLPFFLDEINAQADEFKKIYNKEIGIRNSILEGDIDKPDIVKLNKYINELTALEDELRKNPSRVVPSEWGVLDRYVGVQIANLEVYRDATPDQRVGAFADYVARSGNLMTEAANSLSGRTATYANIYGGINKNTVPQAEFDAVESAANKLLEKVKKVKQIDELILSSKSEAALNSAENSILKNKVPEELTKTTETAKKSASGATAIAAGTAMVFALGPKFVEYGEENNNPYLVTTGETIEYSGLGLFITSAGATVASWMKIALPQVLKGLALTSEGFVLGTGIGLFAVMFVDMIYCIFIDPFGSGCYNYVLPKLALSKTKSSAGDTVSYEISGFEVEYGIGNQDGKEFDISYMGGYGMLGFGCTVSEGKCKGSFSVPSTTKKTLEIFAHTSDYSIKSASVNLEVTGTTGETKNQPLIEGMVLTDKNYLCIYSQNWAGETDIDMNCMAVK